MTLVIRLLGPVQISQDDRPVHIPGYKPSALLSYLVMTGKAHTRQHLVDLLIDRADDPRASLRYTLSELRKAVGAEYIRATRQKVGFNFDADYWLDVTAFEQGELDLYRGDFLEGLHVRDAFGFEDWAFFERERLRSAYQQALTQQLAEAEDSGNDRTVIETAHTLLRLDNLQEQWYRALMQAYARLGQREAAVAQYNVCRQVLAEEMGLEPSEETTSLYKRLQTGNLSRGAVMQGSKRAGEKSPRPPRSSAPLHNLSPQPTPFVGRTEELAQITKRLENPTCRLLTLTGPGGIGKTRLALQAASNLIESPAGQTKFSSGVYFVDLAPVASPDSLVSTIADAIKFSIYSDINLRQQLLEYLREKEMLLILDNFEHLLDSSEKAIDLVTDILAVAPTVKILVTSREALNLREEWLFAIDGMTFPTNDTASSLEEYSAVQLFVQCARRVQPGFSLTAEQSCVMQICRLVEGMPLGIELAAAWLKMFSCERIAQELEQGLDFLSTSLKNIPARHHSMRAVFEHSWNLLSEGERRILRQLAVFRGGFRQEAAEQVAGATFADLVALVEKSLLYRTPAKRYQMHELLRQFAAEKLELDPDEQKAAQQRHSHYYLSFVHQREDALKGQDQQAVVAEINAEIDNVRSGWQWAVIQENVAEIGQTLTSIWLLYEGYGWFQEGKQVCGRVVAKLSETNEMDKFNGEKDLVRGKALTYQSWFCYRLGLHSRARDLGREGLAILRQLDAQNYPGARRNMTRTLHLLGNVARVQGEYAEAKQLLQEELAICKEVNSPWQSANVYIALSVAVSELGEYLEAQRLLDKYFASNKTVDDPWLTGYALDDSGKLAQRLGNYEEAKRHHQAALALRQELGDQLGIAWSLNGLGAVAYAVGEYPEAERLCQESLTLFSEIGNQLGMMDSLNRMGCVTLALGQPQTAKDYFLKSMRIATETQTPAMALDALMGMAMFLMEKGEQERAIELLALPLHHPASWQIFKDRATRLQTELETKLPPEVVSAALERGQARDLETTVAELLNEIF